jgi:hypothetical protein
MKAWNAAILGTVIIWAGVIIATALVLAGTGYFGQLIPILGGGGGEPHRSRGSDGPKGRSLRKREAFSSSDVQPAGLTGVGAPQVRLAAVH